MTDPNDKAIPQPAPLSGTLIGGLTKREYMFIEILKANMIAGAILNWRNPLEFCKAESGMAVLKSTSNIVEGAVAELNKEVKP